MAIKTDKPAKKRKLTLSEMVDRLATVNAQASRLNREADDLKKALKASGKEEIAGSRHKAVIVTSTRSTLDSAKVRETLSEKQLEACTVQTEVKSVSLYDL